MSEYKKIIKEYTKGIKKRRKQKAKSFFPSWEEWHSPSANFNGRNTKVEDRFALRYTGDIGTDIPHLPSTLLDKAALNHDIFFFAPDQQTHKRANQLYNNYVKEKGIRRDPITFVSDALITGDRGRIFTGEMMRLGLFLKGFLSTGISAVKKLENLFRILGEQKTRFTDPVAYNRMMRTRIASQWRRGRRQAENPFEFNPQAFERALDSPFWWKKWELTTDVAMPLIFILGSGYNVATLLSKPIREMSKAVSKIFEEQQNTNERVERVETEANKVINKYDDYLEQVGYFDTGTYDFIVWQEGVDKEKAKQSYKEFYDEWKNYLQFINKEYYYDDNFIPYKIPELNVKKLDDVVDFDLKKHKTPTTIEEQNEFIKKGNEVIQNNIDFQNAVKKAFTEKEVSPRTIEEVLTKHHDYLKSNPPPVETEHIHPSYSSIPSPSVSIPSKSVETPTPTPSIFQETTTTTQPRTTIPQFTPPPEYDEVLLPSSSKSAYPSMSVEVPVYPSVYPSPSKSKTTTTTTTTTEQPTTQKQMTTTMRPPIEEEETTTTTTEQPTTQKQMTTTMRPPIEEEMPPLEDDEPIIKEKEKIISSKDIMSKTGEELHSSIYGHVKSIPKDERALEMKRLYEEGQKLVPKGGKDLKMPKKVAEGKGLSLTEFNKAYESFQKQLIKRKVPAEDRQFLDDEHDIRAKGVYDKIFREASPSKQKKMIAELDVGEIMDETADNEVEALSQEKAEAQKQATATPQGIPEAEQGNLKPGDGKKRLTKKELAEQLKETQKVIAKGVPSGDRPEFMRVDVKGQPTSQPRPEEKQLPFRTQAIKPLRFEEPDKPKEEKRTATGNKDNPDNLVDGIRATDAVVDALLKPTPKQMRQKRAELYNFITPDDQNGGIGTRFNNPLIKRNYERWMETRRGNVSELYNNHELGNTNNLMMLKEYDMKDIDKRMTRLRKLPERKRGLIRKYPVRMPPQVQSREEKQDFQPLINPPSNYYEGSMYAPYFVSRASAPLPYEEYVKQFYGNPNEFYDGAYYYNPVSKKWL